MPKLEVLIASILYLMTKQRQSAEAGLEQAIVVHLQMLASHPECDSKVLKDTGQRLAGSWREKVQLTQFDDDDQNSAYEKRNLQDLH